MVSFTTAPIDVQIVYLMEGLQKHCPDNIRVDHMTVERQPMLPGENRRIVVTVTRDGNPRPITFWAKCKNVPGEHWFPYHEVLAKIGLLA